MPSEPLAGRSWLGFASIAIGGCAVIGMSCLPFAPLPTTDGPIAPTMRPASADDSLALNPTTWAKPQWALASRNATPPAAAGPAKTRNVRLIAIMTRTGRLSAAMQEGTGGPLFYLAAGDSQQGITVLEIERSRAKVLIDSREEWLEIRP